MREPAGRERPIRLLLLLTPFLERAPWPGWAGRQIRLGQAAPPSFPLSRCACSWDEAKKRRRVEVCPPPLSLHCCLLLDRKPAGRERPPPPPPPPVAPGSAASVPSSSYRMGWATQRASEPPHSGIGMPLENLKGSAAPQRISLRVRSILSTFQDTPLCLAPACAAAPLVFPRTARRKEKRERKKKKGQLGWLPRVNARGKKSAPGRGEQRAAHTGGEARYWRPGGCPTVRARAPEEEES